METNRKQIKEKEVIIYRKIKDENGIPIWKVEIKKEK